MKNREDAEDATQDTLLETWIYCQNHEVRSLTGFLVNGVRLRSLRSLSKSRRRQELAQTIPYEDFHISSEQSEELHSSKTYNTWTHNDPRSTGEMEDLGEVFLKARLNEKQRRRLYLHDYEGRTYYEIAKLEGVKYQSIQVCVNSARLALKRAAAVL